MRQAQRVVLPVKTLLPVLGLCAACSGTAPQPPPVPSTKPSVAPSTVAATTPNTCDDAAALRRKVPTLLQQGRLHRAARTVHEANRLCPATASDTWSEELETLVELGHYTDARLLADRIATTSSMKETVKQAAAAALEKLAGLEKTSSKSTTNEADVTHLFSEAAVLARNVGDTAALNKALATYLAAWKLSRPNGKALLAAGHVARILGDEPLSRRLYDRGVAELETKEALAVDVAIGFVGPGAQPFGYGTPTLGRCAIRRLQYVPRFVHPYPCKSLLTRLSRPYARPPNAVQAHAERSRTSSSPNSGPC